jgi:hypothetical protein
MGKKSESGMNNPDHISESLETIFWVKILKFFDLDPGSGIFLTLDRESGIRDGKNSDPG